MTDYVGLAPSGTATLAHYLGDDFGATQAFEREATVTTVDDTFADGILTEMFNLEAGPGKPNKVTNTEFVGLFKDMEFPEFFEDYHVVPRLFDFGNILSTQTSPLTVFSGFRKAFGTWSSFVNNAGAGTTLLGVPSLPTTMNPLAGHLMTLEVSTIGNPNVDDVLAFVFDFGGTTINVPITLSRLVLFPVRPEIPYVEKLQFLTDVITTDDGSEQRISVRKNPRQLFEWDIRVDDGEYNKARLDALMFEWQPRAWGVPMWHESTELTVANIVGDLTINVTSTANADYRGDMLVLVYTDSQNFEVQTIDSLTATTITLKNAMTAAFAVGTTVTPLRTGHMKERVQGTRFRSADQTLRVQFRITDNDSDLADTTGWSTHNSKVLLDDCNVMVSTTIRDTFERNLVVVDNQSGMVYQDSPWAVNKHGSTLTLRAQTRAGLWDIRQLLHALRGRQISFYLPTFNKDLFPAADLVSASQDLVIDNIGYNQFVQTRQNKDRIWLRQTDGTVITKQITSSTETSSVIETLVVDSIWGSNIAVVDIDRISYLEEVRFNSDEVTIRYELGERTVRVSAPIISTFD